MPAGNRELLAKCVGGYTQNANESFHSLVWKYCPKVLHLGIRAVEIACALAISQWNDRLSSLRAISNRIGTPITTVSSAHLQQRDVYNPKKARYRASDRAKALRRRARRIRKGLEDTGKRSEGGAIYA